jgi:hypothetical protein
VPVFVDSPHGLDVNEPRTGIGRGELFVSVKGGVHGFDGRHFPRREGGV